LGERDDEGGAEEDGRTNGGITIGGFEVEAEGFEVGVVVFEVEVEGFEVGVGVVEVGVIDVEGVARERAESAWSLSDSMRSRLFFSAF
jgi:hypothetical protein